MSLLFLSGKEKGAGIQFFLKAKKKGETSAFSPVCSWKKRGVLFF